MRRISRLTTRPTATEEEEVEEALKREVGAMDMDRAEGSVDVMAVRVSVAGRRYFQL